jgi:hypothetical protein
MLLTVVSGRIARLVRHPGPELVEPGVKGVLASVQQNDLARNLRVGSTTVLVGPLDGQHGAFVVVHAHRLVERHGAIIRGGDLRVVVETHLVLHGFIANRPLAGVTSLVVVLTAGKRKDESEHCFDVINI